MTYINVTTTQAEVVITEENGAITTVTTASAPSILTAVTEGPQGPQGLQGPQGPTGPQGPQGPSGSTGPLGSLSNVDTTAVTDGSILYYDSASSLFKANTTWTTTSLSDGGNF